MRYHILHLVCRYDILRIMEVGYITTDILTTAIQQSLSRPTVAPGMRLHSDRELARRLQVGVSVVRTSLQELERKGLVTRRQGSGTYVRRPGTMNTEQTLPAIDFDVPADALFKSMARQPVTGRSSGIRLRFGLWGDWHMTSPANQQVYAAVVAGANARGHEVTAHSMYRNHRQMFSVEELREQLHASPRDGHIVLRPGAERFEQACGNERPPVLYYSAGSLPLHEPMVSTDTGEAARRAVNILHRSGHSRIALLTLAPGAKYTRPDQAMYDIGLNDDGLTYRAVSMAEDSTIAHTMRASGTLLDRADRPEAMYVADDHLLPGLVEVCRRMDLQIGRDIGVVTLANRNLALPEGYNWSRMEFDAEEIAHILLDKLIEMSLHSRTYTSSVSVHGHWVAGCTHQRDGANK